MNKKLAQLLKLTEAVEAELSIGGDALANSDITPVEAEHLNPEIAPADTQVTLADTYPADESHEAAPGEMPGAGTIDLADGQEAIPAATVPVAEILGDEQEDEAVTVDEVEVAVADSSDEDVVESLEEVTKLIAITTKQLQEATIALKKAKIAHNNASVTRVVLESTILKRNTKNKLEEAAKKIVKK